MGLAHLAEEKILPTFIEFDPNKWFYGIGVLVVFLLLLVVVTRFNIDR
jgi:hypothetical protein